MSILSLHLRCKTRKTDDEECRVSRTNKHVCQLHEELYTPLTDCFEIQDKGCPVCCCIVHTMHLQSPEISLNRRKNVLRGHICKHQQQVANVLNRVTPSVFLNRNFPQCGFLKFSKWQSPASIPVLPHYSHSTARKGGSHLLLPNPELPMYLQAKNFKIKYRVWQVGSLLRKCQFSHLTYSWGMIPPAKPRQLLNWERTVAISA